MDKVGYIMSRCHACNAPLKRGQSHCPQCGERIENTTGKRRTLPFIFLTLLILGAAVVAWLMWNDNSASPNTASKPDKQQSFSASTTPEQSENPTDVEEQETLPETEIITGTFFEDLSSIEVEQFMYNFVDAFTSATYKQSVLEVEAYLAPNSEFEQNTIDYLENTLFERNILEDQLETSLLSLTVDGETRDIVRDDETAIVTMKETYRIIQEDSSVIASFETTYKVIYQEGYLKIQKNLGSEELSREEETY